MTGVAAAHAAEERLQSILKAVVVGGRGPDPSSRPGGEDLGAVFASAGALEPPYDPEALCLLVEHSNSLRQNVDAYSTNIDGFGHRLEPAIDLEADDADQEIAEAIFLEQVSSREGAEPPTDEAIAERKEELRAVGRRGGGQPLLPDGAARGPSLGTGHRGSVGAP